MRVAERLDLLLTRGAVVGPFGEDLIRTLRAEEAVSVGTLIGPYRLLSTVGEGGMGVVYLAEQEHPLRRRLAVKVIKLGMDTRRVVARFEAERQTLALMEHPHIATVFDAGATTDGRPYFAMEYLPGQPITEYCDRQHLSIRGRLELFTQVCEAIQHAHQKGVIHRDLKPGNVLVADVDGRRVPKVIDFGIAKATNQHAGEQTQFTELGLLVGTPEYMSPEQMELTADVDTRTDIYSLGVLLYELLVGAVPFDRLRLRRAGFAETQRIIREEEPLRPSTHLDNQGVRALDVARRRQTDVHALSRALRGDLDWIAMKALDKDRGRRYASASEFGADVARFQAHEPVAARPPSVNYRVLKFVRRHRWPVFATMAFLVSILSGLGMSTWLYIGAEQARREAQMQRVTAERERTAAERAQQEASRDRARAVEQQRQAETARAEASDQRGVAERHRDEALRQEYASRIQAAALSINAGAILEARRQLELCEPRLRGWEWRHLTLAAEGSIGALRLPGDRDSNSSMSRVDRLIFDPARHRLTALSLGFAGTRNGTVRFENSKHLPGLEAPQSPDSIIALSGDGAKAVMLHWSVRRPSQGPFFTTVLEGDGTSDRFLLKAEADQGAERRSQLTVIDTDSRAVLATLDVPDAGVWRSPVPLASPPLVRFGAEMGAVYGSLSSYRPMSFVNYPRAVSAAMNNDGSTVAAWSWDYVIRVWNGRSGTPRAQLRGHTDLISAVVVSNDGKRLVSGSHDGTVRLWDIESGAQIALLEGPKSPVTAIARHDSPSLIAAGTEDGFLWVWSDENPVGVSMASDGGTSLAFISDGAFPSSVSRDRPIPMHEGTITSLAFSPDGTLLASASRDRTLRVSDLSTRSTIRVFRGHPGEIRTVSFRPDGRILASGGLDSTIRLWSMTSQPSFVAVSQGLERLLGFGAGGETLLTTIDGEVKTREIGTGRVLRTLKLPRRGVGDSAASPRGDRIAVGINLAASGVDPAQRADAVRIFDANMTRQISELRVGRGVSAFLFDPSGQLLVTVAVATSDGPGAVHVWHAETGRLLAGRDLAIPMPISFAFSPDGRNIALAGTRGLEVLDVNLRKPPLEVRGWFNSVAYLPDGTLVVGTDRNVELRDGRSGTLVGELVGHDRAVRGLAIHPSGTRIFTAGHDDTFRVWDTATRALLLTLPAPGAVWSLTASEDGETVVGSGARVRVWHAALPRKVDPLNELFAVR
jgi:WD40 repeat protein/serine/threonine protein kinase